MLTVKDLNFSPTDDLGFCRARVDFPNGYGLSIINGPFAYCDSNTFEVAITRDGSLCYDTPITDDVLGYQTLEDIEALMKKVEMI
jgi:hypothetical protein